VAKKRDRIYADPQSAIEPFQFDGSVAKVFRDMIERSVPGYGLLLEMIALIAERHAQPHSRCYDLGCSLGDSTLAIADGLTNRFANWRDAAVQLIAVDNSPEMLAACRRSLEEHGVGAAIDLLCQDIRDTAISDATLVSVITAAGG